MTNQTILVNNVEIVIATFNNEKYVAMKPICDAIGVTYSRQLKKAKEDEILNSVMAYKATTGADGKEYKMRAIPLKYVFGWLFMINPDKVKPEIKETVIKYKLECYNALFNTFTKRNSLLTEKSTYLLEIDKLEAELKQDVRYKRIQELKGNVRDTSSRLNALDKGVIEEQLNLFKGE